MKIIKILGGLGNQMFQYALYLALKEKFPNEKIKIDLSCFNGYPLHNGFELNKIFKLSYDTASFVDLLKVSYPYSHYRLWQIGKYLFPKRKSMCIEKSDFSIDSTVLSQEGKRYFDGYWQNEYYFKDIRPVILKNYSFFNELDMRNEELLLQIIENNSVSIHIRRGDYLKEDIFRDICNIDYYKSSFLYLKERVNPNLYCIFSNDIDWCKFNLSPILFGENVIYINWNKGEKSYIDMCLMSNCKHNIIANSSFSWWGAWLNQNSDKLVLAPKKWMNRSLKNDPIPEEWIRI